MSLRFRFVFRPPGTQKLNEPVRIVYPKPKVYVAAEEHIEWSPTEITSMSQVNDDDIDETRAWLKRLGASEALAAFDS